MFGVRASALIGVRPRAEAAFYVSELLISSDVREQQRVKGQTVYLLADSALGALYDSAIASVGAQAVLVDGHAAFVAGITAI